MALPTTYNEFLKEMSIYKNNPVALQSYIDITFNGISPHYDTSKGYGHIAPNTALAYEKIANSKPDEIVPKLKCATAVDMIAKSLQEIGINEATTVSTLGTKETGGGGHALLLYSLEKGKYVAHNWGNSISFQANDIEEASAIATANHPTLLSHGYNTIKTKDGNHIAYSDFALGGLLKENPDKNSPNSLREPLEMQHIDKKELAGDLNITATGKDPIEGEYQAITSGAKVKAIETFGDIDCRINAKAAYSIINTEKTFIAEKLDGTNPQINKKTQYNVFNASVSTMVTTPKAETEMTSTYGFLMGDVKYNKTDSKGVITGNITDTNKPLLGSASNGDLTAGIGIGASSKINGENTNASATVFGEIRAAKDSNNFDQSWLKARPEIVTGAEIKGSATTEIGDADVSVTGETSGVKVLARGYTTDVIGVKGEISATDFKNTASIYTGFDNKSTSFSEFSGIHKDQSIYMGGSYKREIAHNTTLGADISSSTKGTDLKTLGHNIKTGINVGFNF